MKAVQVGELLIYQTVFHVLKILPLFFSKGQGYLQENKRDVAFGRGR